MIMSHVCVSCCLVHGLLLKIFSFYFTCVRLWCSGGVFVSVVSGCGAGVVCLWCQVVVQEWCVCGVRLWCRSGVFVSVVSGSDAVVVFVCGVW